jgi:hypothetical protein
MSRAKQTAYPGRKLFFHKLSSIHFYTKMFVKSTAAQRTPKRPDILTL